MSVKKMIRAAMNKVLSHRGLTIINHTLERDSSLQLKLTLDAFNIDRILDVGANKGQFALELLKNGFMGEIWSVEPLPDAHAILVESAKRHHNWHVVEAVALGSSEGKVEITVAGNSYSSSILEMLESHIAVAPDSAPVSKLSVKQTTLDSLFFEVLKNKKNTLLKIDTQGYEYVILQGANAALEQVDVVLLELSLQPLYKDQMLWLELIAYMKTKGFQVWSIQPELCNSENGQLLQVNGIFARINYESV